MYMNVMYVQEKSANYPRKCDAFFKVFFILSVRISEDYNPQDLTINVRQQNKKRF